jgi:hypothetical protein
MPDENRVFDIAKPGRGTPQATSKPVIVGHRPAVNDPMVNEEPKTSSFPAETTHISVQDDSAHEGMENPLLATDTGVVDAPQSSWNGQINSDTSSTAEEVAPVLGAVAAAPEPTESAPIPEEHTTPSDQPVMDSPAQLDPIPQPPEDHVGHVEGLHISAPKKKSRLPWVVLVLLLLLVGAYLAIDSGAVKTSLDLPFHVFKQKTTPVATTTPQPKATTAPAGFTVYQITSTPITFAAPALWGEPTSTLDAGYTSRSEGAKSDGTHAYIIDFAINKDVQVAVTSSKYLPASRAIQYYDFLQWCTGTSDGKIYLGVLQFTTTNKVDKATTVSCNQGPIMDAVKLNSTTISELNSKAADGSVFGDLYTKNLTDKEFAVFRVKDKAMKNGTQIKQLLNTIKVSAGTTSTKPAQ